MLASRTSNPEVPGLLWLCLLHFSSFAFGLPFCPFGHPTVLQHPSGVSSMLKMHGTSHDLTEPN